MLLGFNSLSTWPVWTQVAPLFSMMYWCTGVLDHLMCEMSPSCYQHRGQSSREICYCVEISVCVPHSSHSLWFNQVHKFCQVFGTCSLSAYSTCVFFKEAHWAASQNSYFVRFHVENYSCMLLVNSQTKRFWTSDTYWSNYNRDISSKKITSIGNLRLDL